MSNEIFPVKTNSRCRSNSLRPYHQNALVLDLDETLISSTTIKPKDQIKHFTFKYKRKTIYVRERPGLSKFLSEVSKYFDIYFFTCSDEGYANPIINHISPDTPLCRRFFRESCSHMLGFQVKDLTLLRRGLSNIILVDDMSGSGALQPQNFLWIKGWDGQQHDNLLLNELLPALRSILFEPNVCSEIAILICILVYIHDHFSCQFVRFYIVLYCLL